MTITEGIENRYRLRMTLFPKACLIGIITLTLNGQLEEIILNI